MFGDLYKSVFVFSWTWPTMIVALHEAVDWLAVDAIANEQNAERASGKRPIRTAK